MFLATGSFHVAECFQGLSTLEHGSVLCSFLWPNNILPYASATLYLSIHQLMDIRAVSIFWLRRLMLP